MYNPDALVGRRIAPCLRLLLVHGFRVLSGAVFTYNRHLIRETWRYQFNLATPDRIAVVDTLLPATPSLLVVLRDERAGGDPPAAVRLGDLKGPSEPSCAGPVSSASSSAWSPPC